MGSIAISVPINRALKTLLDDIAPAPNTNYSAPELLDYANASIRLVCLYKPDVFVAAESFTLAAGARQTLGTRGHTFIRAPGFRQFDMDDLDHAIPGWTSQAQAATEGVIPDKDHPRDFWVYPPAAAAATIPIVYGATPPVLTATTDLIPIDDVYEPVIYMLILAHAYSKNYKLGDIVKMNNYLQQAANGLGLKLRIQLATSPLPAKQEQQSEGG